MFLFKTIKSADQDQDIFQKSICPKYLICDAAKSIQNAFIVFGSDVTIIMCWAHMKKCVHKKAEQIVHPKEKRNEILKDIDLLPLNNSKHVFEKASHLLYCTMGGRTTTIYRIFPTQIVRQ
uniref:MULE transposase domain-containing protein n=1 Tax=Photinus pyralis TaxID=7054 RepID=A0A1Y1LMY5_PHOPY